MALQVTPWVPPLVVAFAVMATIGVYGTRSYRHHPEQTHLLAFGVFTLSVSGWIALTAGQQFTTSHALKLLLANAASAVFIPLGLYGVLWFALTYTENDPWANRWLGAIAAVHVLISVVALALYPNLLHETRVVTESGATLFGMTFEPYVVLQRDFKTGFVLLQLYGYAVLLTSGGIIGRFLFRYRNRLYRGQAVALLTGILVPVTVNGLLFTRVIPADYHLTELSMSISGVAFAVGIFRYRLFDLVPIARDTVIEDMRDGFVVCNDRDVILDANPAAHDILGYGAGSLTGRRVVEVLPGVEPLLRTPGGETTREIQLDTDDGEIYLAVSVSSVGDDGDRGRLVTFRDVTERHRYERELEEERAKYSTLVEQSHDGVAIIQDGVFVFVNPQIETLLGRDESALLGASVEQFISPKDRDTVLDRYERRLRGEDVPDRYDVELTSATGEQRVVELQATAITYEGEPAVLTTLNDITERKNYERSLEERNEKLEVLNRIVRHDIRNDMNVVMGHAQMLDDRLDGKQRNETVSQSLDALETHSHHVVELTDVVRDLMETMQDDGEALEPVSLRPVLEAELEDLRSSTEDAVVRTSTPVPEVDVFADDMLGSVFRNVLTNAVNHSDAEQPEVEVSVTVEGDTAVVSVADNGPGVPDSQKDEVFGKGEMGTDSSGTGIGLYLVHTLVASYGGEVWVEDNEPQGAVFSIELECATRGVTETSVERSGPS